MQRHSAIVRGLAVAAILALFNSGAEGASYQKVPPAARSPADATVQGEGRVLRIDEENARDTRNRLMNLLRQYPPSLSEVLRLDPSLLTNQAYLAPYPALAAFLTQHPEVAHNPGFFVGDVRDVMTDPDRRRIQAWQDILIGFEVLVGFVAAIYTLGSVLKSVIDYRRWLRASKVQADVHSKLLDRMTSNEELMAYMQTPAGRRFLESAPIAMEAGPRPISAPVGRILWSIQAGLIAALAGLSLLYTSARFSAEGSGLTEAGPPLFLIGMLSLAIGAGFVLSAIVAYLLSNRLGLFERTAATAPHA